MDSVENKTAVITGAAGGIGSKCAETLLRNGARRVAVVDLVTSKGREVADKLEKEFGEGRAVFLACNVTRADDFRKTIERVVDVFGGLDIFVNNAGMLDENRLEQTVDLDLTAVIRGSLLALDHMGKHKGGKGGVIVNVASTAGLITNKVCIPIYAATKHGVVGFGQNLGGFYDVTGVRVLTLCPGVTNTSLAGDIDEKVLDFVKLSDAVDKCLRMPQQTVDDVARAMVDLIRMGESGAVWVVEDGKPPYAVDFVHYSKRAIAVDKF